VDVGASATKAVVIDSQGNILGSSVNRTTTNLGKLAEKTLNEALEKAGIPRDSIKYIIATGYGRENVEFADEMKTEISCHSKGGQFPFKDLNEPMAIIDIGGQDNKVIKMDKEGKIINFKMNSGGDSPQA
jgi:activator of 2-hydroxyglutaryl-CoA dehydratase